MLKLVNKAITDRINKNSVILDPAGLHYMKSSFIGAGGASGIIYSLLNTNKPNPDVISHFSQFKTEDNLYEKNSKDLSVAYYSSYNNDDIKLIHTVGPNFMNSNYLKDIIMDDDNTRLYQLFYKIYNDIYYQFIIQFKLNNRLKLRLLPISSGIFINNNYKLKVKIYKAFINNCLYLNRLYKIEPTVYLYDKNDYELMKLLCKVNKK